jgi:hypothetical protein
MTTEQITTPQKTGLSALVGRKMNKVVKFMGEDIKISKLSVDAVLGIQAKAEKIKDTPSETDGLDLLKTVIRLSVEGAEELSDEDFSTFPMDELSNLSNTILVFSGISSQQLGK